MEKVTKDRIDCKVKIGDTVAYCYTYSSTPCFSKGKVSDIKDNGRVILEGHGGQGMKHFIKIFDQDE